MFEKSSINQAVNSVYKTLQNQLIKTYQPQFNILLKEGNPYLYILISQNKIPTMQLVRTKNKKGKPVTPYNPDKEEDAKIGEFLEKNGLESTNGEIIRFHDVSIKKPDSWGARFQEVAVPGCTHFKFYKLVNPKTKGKS